ncbi:GGDEF domain-containing protein [Paenibacillus nanensis]|uniref:GGDEF domain-containing protein n=1 Tax=Paenibacillus nanensis TaxID=393251 RepID=A0A3A1UV47_9BACL|nr:GGDEF domain-containing protein [Paenibacillus nanensis]RIX50143.1 GGDEF domain-containing protein [Paenibacillus nanensis]
MKYKGRIATISLTMTVHTAYILYYFQRDGTVDWADWLGYPLFITVSYWAGKQYDRAVYYSEKDSMTNLYNRRFVINAFDKITSLASRTNSHIFALVIDCDNFKEINDRYNHHVGDKVLSEISHILLTNTRKVDIVARWGGDEFLVLGQYKDRAGIDAIITRITKQISLLSDELGFHVSLSIGSAIYSATQHHDLSSLVKTADENMYKSKMDKKQAALHKSDSN